MVMKDYYEENNSEIETETANEQDHLEKTVLYAPPDLANENDDETEPFDGEKNSRCFNENGLNGC